MLLVLFLLRRPRPLPASLPSYLRTLGLILALTHCGDATRAQPKAEAPAAEPATTPAAEPTPKPNLPRSPGMGFINPKSMPSNALALSFDDGPDDLGRTDAVLDVLRNRSMHATFFVNTNNWSDVRASTAAQASLRRILAEGHVLASHTDHHRHMGTLDPAQVEAEMQNCAQILQTVLGPTMPPLTLIRMPFGQPLQTPTDSTAAVAEAVGAHGVHVGWTLDPKDYTCTTPACVTDAVLHQYDQGLRGIMLMHAIGAATAQALPGLLDALQKRGAQFVSVESLVQLQFGTSSTELLASARHARGLQ